MPHISLEYSANLKDVIDMAAFCDAIRRACIDTGLFPTAGIRVRGFCAQHCSVADGDPKHGFIDISVRLREGRPQDKKEQATAQIFEAAKTYLAEPFSRRSIALSLEMRDINDSLSPKFGTIQHHLENS